MSSVTLTPTSGSNASGSGSTWTNPGNAVNSDNANPAFVAVSFGGTSWNLGVSGTTGAGLIPGGSTITGVTLSFQCWASGTGCTINPGGVGAVIGSKSYSGTDLDGAAIGTTTGGGFSVGSSSTFPAGMSGLTAADVNSNNFSQGLTVKGPASTGAQVSANAFGMTVYYTTATNSVMPHCIVLRPDDRLVRDGL